MIGTSPVYAVDNNGNNTTGETTAYEWDCFDRLMKVTMPAKGGATSGETVEFEYDSDGMLIGEKSAGMERKFTQQNRFATREAIKNGQDEWETSAMHVIHGTMLASYIGATSRHFGGKQQISHDTKTIFYHTDHLGSVRLITDSHGNIVDSSITDAYGNPLPGATAQPNTPPGSPKNKSAKMLSEFNFMGIQGMRYVSTIKMHNIKNKWFSNAFSRLILNNKSMPLASFNGTNLYIIDVRDIIIITGPPPIASLIDIYDKLPSSVQIRGRKKGGYPADTLSWGGDNRMSGGTIEVWKQEDTDIFIDSLKEWSYIFWNAHGDSNDIMSAISGGMAKEDWVLNSSQIKEKILIGIPPGDRVNQMIFAMGCRLAGELLKRNGKNIPKVNFTMAEAIQAGKKNGYGQDIIFIGFVETSGHLHYKVGHIFADCMTYSSNRDWRYCVKYALETTYDFWSGNRKYTPEDLTSKNGMKYIVYKNNKDGCLANLVVFGAHSI